MSVEEIVNKSKQGLKEMDKNKKKISFDEGFSPDTQDVVLSSRQQSGQQITKSDDQMIIHKNDQALIKADEHQFSQKRELVNYRESGQASKQMTKRMTFWMTDEIYEIFNEIYAKRLLAKKKVDKGMLFCEAVQLLAENEPE